jgi:hypothetical protein
MIATGSVTGYEILYGGRADHLSVRYRAKGKSFERPTA